MRVPLTWLNEYCTPSEPVEELVSILDLTGTKVEAVHHHGVGALERFVVGRVLTAGKHPEADRLSVCTVDVGDSEPAHIVCGAPNVAAGQIVAVARPGAIMPDGTKLKKAKLRGQPSEGMILAEDEVGIGTDHDGIMVLEDGVPGDPLERYLPISTTVLELEITPNRPDCLGLYGVAREVHAATGAPLSAPPWTDDPASAGEVAGVSVEVECPDLCPRFTARVFEDVTIGPSPRWLKQRLMAAGQRPINNVVDITNYVMLVTGQPLHAFDLDRVSGGRLIVRRAADGEQVATLDGQTRTLDSEMVLIADDSGPTSIAGVMGGAESEVSETTTRVLMEAATWVGHNIKRTSAKLALRSEASGRFEKGLAPEQAMDAQALAAQLMVELCGATIAPGTIDVGGPGPEPRTVRLRDARVEGLLGMSIPRERCAEILRALEFGVQEAPDGLDVTVPGFRRNDVYREADLVEEVARIHGLEHLPATLPSRRGASGLLTPPQRARRRAEDALLGAGVTEIVGWSFIEPGLFDRLRLPDGDARRNAIPLRNPMSADQSHLRTTLLGSLLDAARYNASRGMPHVRLWEYGAIYLQDIGERSSPLPEEKQMLGALLTGSARPGTWRSKGDEVDVFAAKGVLAGVLGALRVPFAIEPLSEPFLHPARAASIVVGGTSVGWFGELHPSVAEAWGLTGRVAAFELDFGRTVVGVPDAPQYADLTSFPAVRQDLAVVVGDDVPAARVLETVRQAGGPVLAHAEVFDVYTGPQVGEGRRSLALRLEFRASDRTLSDEDVAPRRERITAALRDTLGGELRG